MKYYTLMPPQATQTSGSSKGSFLSYGRKVARGYKVPTEASTVQPTPEQHLLGLGYMFRDKDLGVAGTTVLGNKETNQDQFCVAELPAGTGLLAPTDKIAVLKGAGEALGKTLLSDSEGNLAQDDEAEDSDDYQSAEDKCFAKGSGATMAGVMIDDTGVTEINVGDSYVLAIIVHPHGKVNIVQLNELDTINANTIDGLILDKRRTQGGTAANITRGTIGGLQFPRAFGDIEARQYGVTHESTVKHRYYDDISGYEPGNGDKLFIVVASDGLIDGFGVNDFEAEYAKADHAYTASKQEISDLKARLNAFDRIDEKTHAIIFHRFEERIQREMRNGHPDLEAVINTALINTLGDRHQQNITTLPDNVITVVASAGPRMHKSLFIAALDGHGSPVEGHIAAQYLSAQFPHVLIETLESKIKQVVSHTPPISPLGKTATSLFRERQTNSNSTANVSPHIISSGTTTPVPGTPKAPELPKLPGTPKAEPPKL